MPGTPSIPSEPTAGDLSAPRLIFWTALAVRVLVITIGHTYRIRPFQDHFQFGWEMGRVARALATGFGYADPFVGHTGPTAWVPPLYPLLMAAVFKITGVYTALSAWILLTINSVFSAAIVPAIYEIAARCYTRKVAVWSAWLWALYPAALQYAIHWVWEMSLTTMLFSFVLVLALRMRSIGEADPPPNPSDRGPHGQVFVRGVESTLRWLLFGFLWGLIALSNSSLLLFLPACGLWILLGASNKSAAIARAALACVLFFAVIAPWMYRNWTTFRAFIPMRSNLGIELWDWNRDGANAIALGAPVQPSPQDPLFVPYAQMGEIAYSKYRGAQAKAWIRHHPEEFALLSLKRFYFFWVSVPHPLDKKPWVEYGRELNYCFLSITGWLGLALSLKRRVPAAVLFLTAFLLVPLPYYFVSVAARFRHPLEPLIAIFTVYLFQSATRRRRSQPLQ